MDAPGIYPSGPNDHPIDGGGIPSQSSLHHNLNGVDDVLHTSLHSRPSSSIFVSSSLSEQQHQHHLSVDDTTSVPLVASTRTATFRKDIALSFLKCIWKMVLSVWMFLGYDNHHHNDDNNTNSNNYYCRYIAHMTVKIVLTFVSLCVWYPLIMGHTVGVLLYLLDHDWYILACTTSLAILIVSLAFTASYEWMWRWQDSCCNVATTTAASGTSSASGGDNYNGNSHGVYTAAATSESEHGIAPYEVAEMSTRRSWFVVTVDNDEDNDDDLPFMECVKKIVKTWVLALLCWFIYSVLMTRLTFRLWMEYDVAHDRHGYYELRLVNTLMSLFFLVGAGFFHWWFFPTNRHIVMLTRETVSGVVGTETETSAAAMQVLI